MISYLKGIIAEKKPPVLVLEVNGIGYELTASMNTFYDLGEQGETAFVYTHLIVREDAHTLFGFRDQQERQLFRTLIKVSGVGPKMAITILSSIAADVFVQSIHDNDTATLVRLPGVGKKTAERLVIEMRDRLKDWQLSETQNEQVQRSSHLREQDAISALLALGYKPQEASKAVQKIADETSSSEDLIRLALKSLVKS